jgi:hypothetical protein
MVTLSASSGGGGDYEYWVARSGKLVKDKMIPGDEFVVPEEGLYKTLELYGLGADTFMSQGQYPKQKRAIVLRILDDGHENYRDLVRTTINYEETARGLGPKTYIGQIFTAIRGGEYPDGEDITDDFWLSMIGGRFQAILTVSDDGQYVNFGKDSIKPCRAKAAKPARKVEDNPLIAEDEEDAADAA